MQETTRSKLHSLKNLIKDTFRYIRAKNTLHYNVFQQSFTFPNVFPILIISLKKKKKTLIKSNTVIRYQKYVKKILFTYHNGKFIYKKYDVVSDASN